MHCALAFFASELLFYRLRIGSVSHFTADGMDAMAGWADIRFQSGKFRSSITEMEMAHLKLAAFRFMHGLFIGQVWKILQKCKLFVVSGD